MKKYRNLILSFLTLLLVASCASHSDPAVIYDPYGFLSGLWHGAIAGLTITVNIISWFLSLIGINLFQDIQIIGRPNTGFTYYLGFVMGFIWLKFL